MNLAQLIAHLMAEGGLSPEDAARAAQAMMKVPEQIVQRKQEEERFISVQRDGRGVDYGEETPEQAKARWYQQELEDPNGLFMGGATAGGVFGNSTIATDLVDPGAMARTLDMQVKMHQATVQQETLRVLQEMQQELRGGREKARELPPARGPRRLLGRKRER